MKPEYVAIPLIFLSFAVAEMIHTKFFRKDGEVGGDLLADATASAFVVGLLQPMVILCGGLLAAAVAPTSEGALSHWPLLAQIGLLLVFDDMTQYWWHRASHTFPWLYKLHRAHHNADYMSVRITYRNNFFYFVLFPSFWFVGALVYLGLGPIYSAYIIVKMAVIYGAHSDVRWDEKLYRVAWLAPVMWVVERTISTPATHAAHHGKYAADPATNYKGNYGNLLFFWDVLFGTAKITRTYPERFGVENLPPAGVGEQLFWPIVRTKPAPTNAPQPKDLAAAE